MNRVYAALLKRPWLTLGLLMGGVAALAVVALFKQSLRLDEAQSLFQASRTPAGIFAVVGEDVHVPLYHLLLHFWQVFFGNGVEYARIMSLGFYLATIPTVFLLGRSVFGKSVGLFAAILFAISPFMNWYGSELRMYTLLTLFSVLSHYFFLKIYRGEGKRSWWFYGAVAVLGIYTHYFFAFVLLTQAIFYFLRRREFPDGSFKRFLIVAGVLVVAFSPWLAYVQSLGSASNTKPNLPTPDSTDVFSTFAQFLFGFPNDRLNALILSLWPITILFGFLALRTRRRVEPEVTYFLLAASLPIVGAFLVSVLYSPVYLTRYLIISLPPLYLFISWLIAGYAPRLANTARFGLVGLMVFMLGLQTFSPGVPVKQDYRAAADYLNEHTSPQDVVVVSAPFTVYPIEYYYTGHASLETLPIWDRTKAGAIPPFEAGKLPEQVKTANGTHRYAFLILSEDQGYEQEIRNYYEYNFQRIDERQLSPDLSLRVYQVRYDLPQLTLK